LKLTKEEETVIETHGHSLIHHVESRAVTMQKVLGLSTDMAVRAAMLAAIATESGFRAVTTDRVVALEAKVATLENEVALLRAEMMKRWGLMQ
jgi:hypothetical protein